LEADDRPSRTSQPQSRTKMRYSRRKDTDDHHALRLALAYRCSSQARRTSGTPQLGGAQEQGSRKQEAPTEPVGFLLFDVAGHQ
jgi:hypothetical protein